MRGIDSEEPSRSKMSIDQNRWISQSSMQVVLRPTDNCWPQQMVLEMGLAEYCIALPEQLCLRFKVCCYQVTSGLRESPFVRRLEMDFRSLPLFGADHLAAKELANRNLIGWLL